MGPGRWQMRSSHRVKYEQHADYRDDDSSGTPRRFQKYDDKNDTEDYIRSVWQRSPIGEIVAAHQRINENTDGGEADEHIPPANLVAEARSHREEQITKHHHEGDVRVTQLLCRNDVVSRVKMKQSHRDRDGRNDRSCPA